MNNIPWSPVLRYATPLPMNRTPDSTVALQHKSVSSVLRYARPLPINRTLFRTWPVEHKAVSSVLRYARPRFHRLFRPSPPVEHDAFCCLPMNTTTTLFLHSDQAMYVCASRRSRPCPYVRTWPYFLSCTLAAVRVHATCAPLLRHVRASTSTSMYVHFRDQNDNATYASTRWVPDTSPTYL